MGVEESSIRKIESGIRGIRMGTKSPQDANCGYFFNKLKNLNEGMYDELMEKYKRAVKHYNERKKD